MSQIINQSFSGVGHPSNLEMSLMYIYDSGVGTSGIYRTLRPSDLAITLNSSGAVSMSSNVNVTGSIPLQVSVISGGLSSTGIQNISGTVQIGNFPGSFAITGNPNVTLSSNIPSGQRVAVTNLVSGASGTFGNFYQNLSGALLVQNCNLQSSSDSVTCYEPIGSVITGATGPQSGIGTVFNAQSRSLGYIMNVGTQPILVALSGNANLANFSLILKGGSTNFDGNGASWGFSNYYGAVSVSGSGILYTAFQF